MKFANPPNGITSSQFRHRANCYRLAAPIADTRPDLAVPRARNDIERLAEHCARGGKTASLSMAASKQLSNWHGSKATVLVCDVVTMICPLHRENRQHVFDDEMKRNSYIGTRRAERYAARPPSHPVEFSTAPAMPGDERSAVLNDNHCPVRSKN
jgi:hypothetical protein